MSGYYNYVKSLFVLNNKTLASSSNDYNIKIWNMTSLMCITTIRGFTNFIWCMIQVYNGLLAFGSNDKTVKYAILRL